MGVKDAGENFPIGDDERILEINSPTGNKPYKVIHKDVKNRWAIVALDWETYPRLGIRWFWYDSGTPAYFGDATWFMFPVELTKSILSGLPLSHEFSNVVEDFLARKITGDELKKWPEK